MSTSRAETRSLSAEERAVLDSVSEQAQLLAMLTGSVPSVEAPPTGTVDLIGALGPLEHPETPGSDPLQAFGLVAPRFAKDAESVATELGAA
ncbi:hypothetical protein [Cryptosporangium sp. NPDC048952]|uniref:hypothetical protein n=1 Tax=Cryptosporangium sp. NPDC048952 TaxID=3363961 RepID=UPI003723779D